MFIFLFLSSTFLNFLILTPERIDGQRCAYVPEPRTSIRHEIGSGQINFETENVDPNQSSQTCEESSYCYSFWTINTLWPENVNFYKVINSGCLEFDDPVCNQSECSGSMQFVGLNRVNNTFHCCCQGEMCNSKLSIRPIDSVSVENFTQEETFIELPSGFFLLSCFLSFSIFLIFVIFLFKKCFKSVYHRQKVIKSEKPIDSKQSHSLSITSPPILYLNCTNDLAEMNFTEIIGNGKFSTVWKTRLNNSNSVLAVKLFAKSNHKYLLNECNIYSLPFMSHPSLPQFFGCGERFNEIGSLEYCLALEYAQNGSLKQYLMQNKFDWTELCRLVGSLVRGVAYLHTEVFNDGKRKPVIVHRDLSSKNVVVKADGSCMIVDYQFAIPFGFESTSVKIDSDSLLVGTATYMAPELLEGEINMRQRETSFKQADVYALALILWEVATRCTDLYQGIEVPAYKSPFEMEIGPHANFDQIRVLVTHNKARPLFPEIWKNSNPAIRLLKETIAECWDTEPEARLTALCIEQRLDELPSLWKRYKRETLGNCCVISTLQGQTLADKCEHTNNGNQFNYYEDDQSNCYINNFENSLNSSNHYRLLHHPYHNHHFHRKQTSANGEKNEKNANFEKNLLVASNLPISQQQLKFKLPLQPYQARNTCIERNLLLDTVDETEGLLERGLKFQFIHNKNNIPGDFEVETEAHEENLSTARATITTRPLLPTPIAYVQNSVGTAEGGGKGKKKDINKYCNRGIEFDQQRESNSLPSKLNILNLIRKKFNQLEKSLLFSNKETIVDNTRNVDIETKPLTESKVDQEVSSLNFPTNEPLDHRNDIYCSSVSVTIDDENDSTSDTSTKEDGRCSSNPSPMISSNCDAPAYELRPNNQVMIDRSVIVISNNNSCILDIPAGKLEQQPQGHPLEVSHNCHI